jgi:hypothetical protein
MCVKLYALANATKSLNWWKRASTIHLYISTPPLTCDGRRESQHVNTDRTRESQHVDTKGGNSNFYNKLRKPGLELKTLGSDTMLSFMH